MEIFKEVLAGKSISAAGAKYGCASELARKRFQWARRRMTHPRYLGGYVEDCWPAGEASGQGWSGADDWTKLRKTQRVLNRLADLRLAEYVGRGQWAISDEGREQAAQMPCFWDGTSDRDAAGLAGSAIARARRNWRIWWLDE